MPIYEYECLECGLHFDRLLPFGAPDPDTCPQGHNRVHRLLGQPAIIFKGSGFYITDHGRNGKGRNGKGRNGKSRADRSRPLPQEKGAGGQSKIETPES